MNYISIETLTEKMRVTYEAIFSVDCHDLFDDFTSLKLKKKGQKHECGIILINKFRFPNAST